MLKLQTPATIGRAERTYSHHTMIYDEQSYLGQNPDVALKVAKGEFASGLDHLLQHGEEEIRSGQRRFEFEPQEPRRVLESARRSFSADEVVFRKCPICAITEGTPVYASKEKDLASGLMHFGGIPQKTLKRLPLVYSYCKPCEHLYISPLPPLRNIDMCFMTDEDKAAIERQYSATKINKSWMEEEDYIRDKLRSFKFHFDKSNLDSISKEGAVLDIGCGSGVSLDYMYGLGWKNCYGLEPHYETAQLARREKRHLNVTWGDVFSADNERFHEFFDLIMLDNAMEHISRPREAMLAIRRMLKSGGRLWISVPNLDGQTIKEQGISYHNLNWGHWSFFSAASLARLLEDGFGNATFYDSQFTVRVDTGNIDRDHMRGLKEDWVQVAAEKR